MRISWRNLEEIAELDEGRRLQIEQGLQSLGGDDGTLDRVQLTGRVLETPAGVYEARISGAAGKDQVTVIRRDPIPARAFEAALDAFTLSARWTLQSRAQKNGATGAKAPAAKAPAPKPAATRAAPAPAKKAPTPVKKARPTAQGGSPAFDLLGRVAAFKEWSAQSTASLQRSFTTVKIGIQPLGNAAVAEADTDSGVAVWFSGALSSALLPAAAGIAMAILLAWVGLSWYNGEPQRMASPEPKAAFSAVARPLPNLPAFQAQTSRRE